MAEPLTALPPLGGYDQAFGPNRLVERSDLAITSVALPQGQTLAPPSGATAIPTGPDQVFLLAPMGAEHDLAGAYATDQTHGWAILDLSGPDSVSAFVRCCHRDLHPDSFAVGASARTVMEHLSVVILRQAKDGFRLMSPSSSAASFLHAVETSLQNVGAHPAVPDANV